MAISASSVDVIEDGFKEIFGVKEIDKSDEKADGGYETVGVVVTDIDTWQFRKLMELTEKVSNSFAMAHMEHGNRLFFY